MLRASAPIDPTLILACHRRGRGDPTYHHGADGSVWRAIRSPVGSATVRAQARAREGSLQVTAWGAGADWVLEHAGDLLGVDDDWSGFRPDVALLARLTRRFAGWRVARSGLVMDALVPAVLEQKVTCTEAWRSWRELVSSYGEPAPGPSSIGELRLRLPPTIQTWRSIPSWQWHRAGVGPNRMRTLLACLPYAARLEETLALDRFDADRRMRALPGIGAWTIAEVRQRAHGDADAVSVGDAHMAKDVGWALTGERLDDAGVVELLQRWRGHRYRITRLIELAGIAAPRRGPRLAPRDCRAI